MSLLIQSEFSPFIYFEARLIAENALKKDYFTSQIGFSLNPVQNIDISMFTQTSGVCFIAGIGSFCAYQLSCRLFGNNFVWNILNFIKCDLLTRADLRLLNPVTESFYKARIGEDDLHRIQELFNKQNNKKKKASKTDLIKNQQKNYFSYQRLIKILSNKNDLGLEAILQMQNNLNGQHKSSITKIEYHNTKLMNNLIEENDSSYFFNSIPSSYKQNYNQLLNNDLGFDNCKQQNNNVFLQNFNYKQLIKQKKNYCDNINISSCSFNKNSCNSSSSDITSVSRTRETSFVHKSKSTLILDESDFCSKCSLIKKENLKELDYTYNNINNCDDSDLLDETASTSLRLEWQDEQLWDDEFNKEDELDEVESGISNLTAFQNLQRMFRLREKESPIKEPTLFLSNHEHTPFMFIQNECNNHRLKYLNAGSAENGSQTESIVSNEALLCEAKNVVIENILSSKIIDKCYSNNLNYLYCSTIVEKKDYASSEIMPIDNSASITSKSNFFTYLQKKKKINKSTQNNPFILNNKRIKSNGLWDLTNLKNNHDAVSSSNDNLVQKCKNSFISLSRLNLLKYEENLISKNASEKKSFLKQDSTFNNQVTDFNKSLFEFSIESTSLTNSVNKRINDKKDSKIFMFDSAIDSAMSESTLSDFSAICLTNKQSTGSQRLRSKSDDQHVSKHFSNGNASATSEITMEWF